MDNQTRNHDEEQLEEHSLPGINMAGKGPGAREDEKRRSDVIATALHLIGYAVLIVSFVKLTTRVLSTR